uniref:Jumonji domain containing 4 n=1 Tax=Astyanax mexicanus TaxID=7994 RepID=A0A8B9J7T5_ASTMX
MDREMFHSCCSLVKIPRSSRQQQPGSSPHFVDYMERAAAYSRFLRNFLLPNQPCMFSSRFTQDWSCRRNWVTEEGKPNFQKLLQEFEDTPVPVANCSAKEYNANPKQIMPFREFIQYWREYIQNGHSSPRGCLYLKDWHMQRMFPEHNTYKTPIYFSSDWLNEYWDTIEVDDYRFVQIPPSDEVCSLILLCCFQVIMKSCTGIDYAEFASFLKTIANNRISFLSSCPGGGGGVSGVLTETLSALGPHHAAFDLQRISHILESMLTNEDFKRLETSALTFKPEELLQEIRDAVHTIV